MGCRPASSLFSRRCIKLTNWRRAGWMVGTARASSSWTAHLTSGVDALKHVRKQTVDTLSTIVQYQYQFSCITWSVWFWSSVICFKVLSLVISQNLDVQFQSSTATYLGWGGILLHKVCYTFHLLSKYEKNVKIG